MAKRPGEKLVGMEALDCNLSSSVLMLCEKKSRRVDPG
jgi:hypothetical protein